MFLNFNKLFQLVLTKFFKSELFFVIKPCKEPIGFPNTYPLVYQLLNNWGQMARLARVKNYTYIITFAWYPYVMD